MARNTRQTSSAAENVGSCRAKSKHHVVGCTLGRGWAATWDFRNLEHLRTRTKGTFSELSTVFSWILENTVAYTEEFSILISQDGFQTSKIFAKVLTATLVATDLELCQRLFPSFCIQPSKVDVLFNGKLSRCPFLRQVVDLELFFVMWRSGC